MKAIFLFFRAEGFYPVEIPPEDLQDNITSNPGTLRVRRLTEDDLSPLVWTDAQGWLDKDLERQQVVRL